jgi:hypothetical protein
MSDIVPPKSTNDTTRPQRRPVEGAFGAGRERSQCGRPEPGLSPTDGSCTLVVSLLAAALRVAIHARQPGAPLRRGRSRPTAPSFKCQRCPTHDLLSGRDLAQSGCDERAFDRVTAASRNKRACPAGRQRQRRGYVRGAGGDGIRSFASSRAGNPDTCGLGNRAPAAFKRSSPRHRGRQCSRCGQVGVVAAAAG